MEPKAKKPNRLAAFFFRGVVTLLPVVLTLVIFGLLFQMVNRYVTGPINATIYWSLERNALGWRALEVLGIDPLAPEYLATELLPLDVQSLASTSPEGFNDQRFHEALSVYRHDHLGFFRNLDDLAIRSNRLRDEVKTRVHPLIGVALSILLVLWLGWLVGGFVGRGLMRHVDHTMTLIPIVKSVYPYSKQMVEFFFEKKKLEFDTVVAVPYPSAEIWSLAFVTNGSLRTLDEATKKQLVCVFLPASPMPMTGYTVFIDVERVIPLSITVEEAVRIIMTGGVLLPPHEAVARAVRQGEALPRARPGPEPKQESA